MRNKKTNILGNHLFHVIGAFSSTRLALPLSTRAYLILRKNKRKPSTAEKRRLAVLTATFAHHAQHLGRIHVPASTVWNSGIPVNSSRNIASFREQLLTMLCLYFSLTVTTNCWCQRQPMKWNWIYRTRYVREWWHLAGGGNTPRLNVCKFKARQRSQQIKKRITERRWCTGTTARVVESIPCSKEK